MPGGRITSRTGNAQIKKRGHTASSKGGSDPNVKERGGSVRELKK